MNAMHHRLAAGLMGIAAIIVAAVPARACPVCFGDPDAPLTKGAESGVLFMLLLTYGLLMGFGGLMFFWFVRARRMRRLAAPSAVISSQSPVERNLP